MKPETAQNILRIGEQSYNAAAQEFSYTREYFWRELVRLKDHVKKGDKVLDVGCGNGRLVTLFEEKDIEYIGVDSAARLVDIARQKYGGKGRFMQADALSLPFTNQQFDVTYSIAVLHHIPSKEFRHQLASELSRVTKSDGTVIITVWYLWQKKFLSTILRYTWDHFSKAHDIDLGDLFLTFGQQQQPRYLHAFTKKELRELLEAHSLRVESIEEVRRKSGYANLLVIAKKL